MIFDVRTLGGAFLVDVDDEDYLKSAINGGVILAAKIPNVHYSEDEPSTWKVNAAHIIAYRPDE